MPRAIARPEKKKHSKTDSRIGALWPWDRLGRVKKEPPLGAKGQCRANRVYSRTAYGSAATPHH